jgi:hypothetical protein
MNHHCPKDLLMIISIMTNESTEFIIQSIRPPRPNLQIQSTCIPRPESSSPTPTPTNLRRSLPTTPNLFPTETIKIKPHFLQNVDNNYKFIQSNLPNNKTYLPYNNFNNNNNLPMVDHRPINYIYNYNNEYVIPNVNIPIALCNEPKLKRIRRRIRHYIFQILTI